MPPKRSLGTDVKRLQVRLPRELYAYLVEKAAANGVSVAVFLRRIIREAMRRES